ncbi:hypothetical protein CIB48_g3129 [Xylaria polymorpha]|nr:hypothetical protein CIB48_g3129 [Xylaria polymorpha]
MSETNLDFHGGQNAIGEERNLQFASLLPGNAAALHLLEAVHASDALIPSLVNDDNSIFYLLSLPSLPISSVNLGEPPDKWRIGAGPLPSLPKTEAKVSKVEILLCPPGNSHGSRHARRSIKSTHAVLLFHPESGALLLRNVCSFPIIYEQGDVHGNDLTLVGNGGPDSSCVLLKRRNHLRFGDYTFVLEFNLRPRDYEVFMAERNRSCHISPTTCLAPVPDEKHFTLWGVRVHGEATRRAQESIYYGVHLHSGQPVALKRLSYKPGLETGIRARTELRLAEASCGTSVGIVGMIASWCEHGESPPCWLEGEPLLGKTRKNKEDVYYTMPLARSDFQTMTPTQWRGLEPITCLDYFRQTLSGLGKIHDMGLVHGNIRPKSLMIISPSKAAISSAVRARKYGVPDHAGYWVAPEVWTSSEEAPYSSKVDVWALAASWLRCFLVPPAGIVKVSEGIHRAIVKALEERCRLQVISEHLRNLLLSMLAWDPRDRPSVEDLLIHTAWEPLRRRGQEMDDRRRRDREEKMTTPADGVKKVRVLSPVDED